MAGSLAVWTLAAMLLFVAVRSAMEVVSAINWYQFRSTTLVMQDLRTGSGRPPPNRNTPLSTQGMGHGSPEERVDLARVALDELLRREKAGHLPEQDRNAIAELALGVQQSWPKLSPVQYHLLDYLDERIVAGDLTAEQQDRFYGPALDEQLTVRPVVLAGDDVPMRLALKHAWAFRGNWLVDFKYQSVDVDGRSVPLSPAPESYPLMVVGGGQQSDDKVGDNRTAPCPSIGHHLLNAMILLRIHYGGNTFPENGPVMRSVTLKLSTPFEVAAPSTQSAVKLIDDPSMVSRLRAAMTATDFQYSNWGSEDILGLVRIAPVPINVAFDVFARYAGSEYPIGQLTQSAGAVGHYAWCRSQMKKSLPKPPPTIEIVLRSSPQAARATLDLYQIWNGEIAVGGVRIKDNAH